MRQPWTKVRRGLRSNLKVLKIAKVLGVTAHAALGMVVDFWGRADDHTTDGNLPGMGLDDVDEYIGVVGFAAALVTVGWLIVEGSGLMIPDFQDHCGDGKSKALNARRAKRHREKEERKAITEAMVPVEKPAPDLDNFLIEMPAELLGQNFANTWRLWMNHRREKRAKLTKTTIKMQLEKLRKMGVDRAVAALKHSMEQGWIGIFEPDTKGQKHGGKQGAGLRYDPDLDHGGTDLFGPGQAEDGSDSV